MENIKEVLKNNNFEFKKHFGQNFLTDTNLLKAIVADANITKEDEVLEIGPGAGALTKELARQAKKVICYEIDKKLEPILKQELAEFDSVQIIFKDILKEEDEAISKHFKGSFKVVANLPYYITTPIIFKFLEGEFDIKSLTIMVQKEVAERLVAKEGTKNYGTITVSANIKADTKITRIVGRQMFTPPPNVDSAIINLTINNAKFDLKNKEVLQSLIKTAFAMRRKTLYNNLKASFNLSSEVIKQVMQNCYLQENIRGEALSLEQFVNLANELNKYLN
jgi:16S rRNA (adenine1518-N6/adenine1519-N6)-dimethyltransferase